jgi:hypothetical protein
MDLEKTYNKWQCTDIEEKYINNIELTQFTKSELFSFAEFYHQTKINNGVLDDVIKNEVAVCDFIRHNHHVMQGGQCIECGSSKLR